MPWKVRTDTELFTTFYCATLKTLNACSFHEVQDFQWPYFLRPPLVVEDRSPSSLQPRVEMDSVDPNDVVQASLFDVGPPDFLFYQNFGFYLILLPSFMRETRSAVLSVKIAKRWRTEIGNPRYRARVEDDHTSLRTLIHIMTDLYAPLHCDLLVLDSLVFIGLMLMKMIVLSFCVRLAWSSSRETLTQYTAVMRPCLRNHFLHATVRPIQHASGQSYQVLSS